MLIKISVTRYDKSDASMLQFNNCDQFIVDRKYKTLTEERIHVAWVITDTPGVLTFFQLKYPLLRVEKFAD